MGIYAKYLTCIYGWWCLHICHIWSQWHQSFNKEHCIHIICITEQRWLPHSKYSLHSQHVIWTYRHNILHLSGKTQWSASTTSSLIHKHVPKTNMPTKFGIYAIHGQYPMYIYEVCKVFKLRKMFTHQLGKHKGNSARTTCLPLDINHAHNFKYITFYENVSIFTYFNGKCLEILHFTFIQMLQATTIYF